MTKDVAKTTTHGPSEAAFVVDPELPVLTHRHDLEAAAHISPHSHPRGQLLWAMEGILRVTTAQDVWIVPSSHAVWIPGQTHHHLVTETVARTRNLYVDTAYEVRKGLPLCEVLLLTPLMRELILRLNETEPHTDPGYFKRLGLVAIDELSRLESVGWNLPAGRDPRLRRLIGHLVRHPATPHTLDELARIAGTGMRTVERLFKAETGMSFRQWRSRLRSLSAVEMLRQGMSSTCIAYTLGFSGPSAFGAAFKEHFGCAPKEFLSAQGGGLSGNATSQH